MVKSGALRALATPSRSRIPPLPEVPTIAEAGYKDFVAEVWFGLVAPAKTPEPIIAQYIDWFGGAIEAPEVKDKLDGPRALSQPALRRRLRRPYPASGRRVHPRDRGAEAQGLSMTEVDRSDKSRSLACARAGGAPRGRHGRVAASAIAVPSARATQA